MSDEINMSAAEIEARKQAKKVLLGQAAVLNMKVDARWSVETLAEKVLEAQEGQEEREQAALVKAADTWVYCIRDCWLGTERHRAGEIIKVPRALYNNWKPSGAARLADEDELAGRG